MVTKLSIVLYFILWLNDIQRMSASLKSLNILSLPCLAPEQLISSDPLFLLVQFTKVPFKPLSDQG